MQRRRMRSVNVVLRKIDNICLTKGRSPCADMTSAEWCIISSKVTSSAHSFIVSVTSRPPDTLPVQITTLDLKEYITICLLAYPVVKQGDATTIQFCPRICY